MRVNRILSFLSFCDDFNFSSQDKLIFTMDITSLAVNFFYLQFICIMCDTRVRCKDNIAVLKRRIYIEVIFSELGREGYFYFNSSLNPSSLRYRCGALTVELSSQFPWELVTL